LYLPSRFAHGPLFTLLDEELVVDTLDDDEDDDEVLFSSARENAGRSMAAPTTSAVARCFLIKKRGNTKRIRWEVVWSKGEEKV
jgi:hypothetical protein